MQQGFWPNAISDFGEAFDKLVGILKELTGKMDHDIEVQAQKVKTLKEKQSKPGAKNDKASSTAMDIETSKLKRMIDKRGQMFDMLRQIIDKYNETSKGVIQAIGR